MEKVKKKYLFKKIRNIMEIIKNKFKKKTKVKEPDTFDVNNMGQFIANIRNERNLSQEDIAKALFIDKRKVSRWETGKSFPETEIIPKLAKVLDVSIIDLFAAYKHSDSFINKMEIFVKSPKSIKKMKLHHKILIVVAILIGIFFGLTTIYTIDNYHTVEIYSMKSLDDDFFIQGIYIKAKDYQIFTVNSLNYIGKNKEKIDISISNIEYGIYDNYNRVIQNNNLPNNLLNDWQQTNLLNILSNLKIAYKDYYQTIDAKNNLIFRIIYRDDNKTLQTIEFPFKLVENFHN